METFGKYQMVRRLGAGGMAEVFLARSTVAQGLAKQLVLKKIHPAYARSKHFVKMFIDEAKIALGLNHPNIVQVFDFGHVSQTFFLAMEYVEGVDLLRLLQEGAKIGRRVPYGLSAYIVQQVAKGLDYAHRKTDEYGDELNIVHRDISPQNVLVSWDGSVKIVDFGIARARDIQEEEGVVKGKFAYMSPEQARGLPVDRRSDIYSAGIVLYELACARPLFSGKGKEVLEAVRAGAIPRPRSVDPQIPAQLEEILLKSLAYHPDDRFQTARDLQHALGRFQLSYATAQGDLFDSGTLAQLVAQLVPRERRSRAQTERPAPQASATPVAAVRPVAGTPAPSAPAPALTPGLGVIQTSESRERKQVLVLEGELEGLESLRAHAGEARAKQAVAEFMGIAEDIAYKHDAHPHRNAPGLAFILGLPVAGEGDASRAIHLALALVDALDGIGRDASAPLRLGVGIQRGNALVTRKGSTWTYEVEGGTTSFARRLARQAPGGEVLVGGAVYHSARGEWNFEELPQMELSLEDADNETAGARAFRLRGPKEREQRMRERAGTEVIGRELELKALSDAYRDVLANRRKHHVVIVGEEGVGKRSLVTAFLRKLPPGEANVLRASCRATTSDAPFSMVADLTRDLLGLAEGAGTAEIVRRLQMSAAMLYSEAEAGEVAGIVETMGRLLGVQGESGGDAEERRARIIGVLRRIQNRLTADQPLIVVVEDAHWADSQSWDVFFELIAEQTPRPLLGVATARPDERILAAASEASHTTTLVLDELGPEERLAYVTSRFAPGEDVAPLAEEIVAKAAGNPLFLREVLEALIDRGIVAESKQVPGKLSWVKRDLPVSAPNSLAALVAARLDRLPAAEKEVLSRAAIFGRELVAGDIAALVGRPVDEELASLVRRLLLAATGTGFAFRNEVTLQVAYDAIPTDDRAPLHRRAAERLAGAPGYRAGQDDARVARQLELAGERTEAARRYLTAANHARDVRGNLEAFRHLTRALALLPREAHAERFAARAEREAILRAWAQRPRQLRELHLMRREAEAAGDPGKQADTLARLGQLYVDVGRLDAARKILPPALAAARRARDPLLEAEVLRVEALVARAAGENAEALDLADRALSLCGNDRAGLLERAQILTGKGVALWYMSRLSDAIEAHAEALVIWKNLRVRRQEARALNNMGIVFTALGEYEEALSSYKRALKIDQDLGDRLQVALKLANIGGVYVEVGELDKAEQYLKKAISISEQLRDASTQSDACITLGQAYLKRGEAARARRVLERGLSLAETSRDRYQEIRGAVYLALARLSSGDDPRAVIDMVRKAAEEAHRAPLPIAEVYGLAVEAQALAQLGMAGDAADRAAEAARLLETTNASEGADEVHYIHARLARAAGREDEARAALRRAHDVVMSKARRLRDPGLRQKLLSTPPARDILAATGGAAEASGS